MTKLGCLMYRTWTSYVIVYGTDSSVEFEKHISRNKRQDFEYTVTLDYTDPR